MFKNIENYRGDDLDADGNLMDSGTSLPHVVSEMWVDDKLS